MELANTIIITMLAVIIILIVKIIDRRSSPPADLTAIPQATAEEEPPRRFRVRRKGVVLPGWHSFEQIAAMLKTSQLTVKDEVLEEGADEYLPLAHTDITPARGRAPIFITAQADSRSWAGSSETPYSQGGGDLGERLNRAALIFAGIGVACGLLGGLASGDPMVFLLGFSGPVGLAVIMAVLGHVMKGRQV